VEEIEIEAAKALWIGEAEKAHVSELPPDAAGQFAIFFPIIDEGHHLLLQKVAEGMAEGVVVGSEVAHDGAAI